MDEMRLIRKVSRRRRKMSIYEYERIFIPIPADEQEVVQPWVGKDMKIFVKPIGNGFAILAVPEDKRVQGGYLSQIFGDAVAKLDSKPSKCP